MRYRSNPILIPLHIPVHFQSVDLMSNSLERIKIRAGGRGFEILEANHLREAIGDTAVGFGSQPGCLLFVWRVRTLNEIISPVLC